MLCYFRMLLQNAIFRYALIRCTKCVPLAIKCESLYNVLSFNFNNWKMARVTSNSVPIQWSDIQVQYCMLASIPIRHAWLALHCYASLLIISKRSALNFRFMDVEQDSGPIKCHFSFKRENNYSFRNLPGVCVCLQKKDWNRKVC